MKINVAPFGKFCKRHYSLKMKKSRENDRNRPRRGAFITFEGPEGAGKSSQLRLLAQYLESRGRSCLCTREPGGTPLAETIRAVVMTFRLLSYLGCCKQHCNEHWGTCILLNRVFLQINAQEWDCWLIW